MWQILSLWRGLLYRLHCFRLSTEQCSSVLCMHTADCTIWSMTCKLHTESEMGAILDSISDLCFAASYAANVLPKLQFDNWVIWVIAAFIQFVLAALLRDSSRWDGLLWDTPSQTGLPAACCSCSRLQTCSFPAKSRHWLQLLFAMPVPVSLLWQQRFGKRWWPSWRLPEIQTGMQAAVDA